MFWGLFTRQLLVKFSATSCCIGCHSSNISEFILANFPWCSLWSCYRQCCGSKLNVTAKQEMKYEAHVFHWRGQLKYANTPEWGILRSRGQRNRKRASPNQPQRNSQTRKLAFVLIHSLMLFWFSLDQLTKQILRFAGID